MCKYHKIIIFFIFGMIILQSEKLLASNLLLDGTIGEEQLKGVSIHKVPTYLKPLPIVCIQMRKWINVNGLEEKYSSFLSGNSRMKREQCQALFDNIEKEKNSQLGFNNLSPTQQMDMIVGEELRENLGKDYEKLMPISLTGTSTLTSMTIGIGEAAQEESRMYAQIFLKNLEQSYLMLTSNPDGEEKNQNIKKILQEMIRVFTVEKVDDAQFDKFFESMVNLCTEIDVLPDAKADFMYGLYIIQTNNSLENSVRRRANNFLKHLKRHIPFSGDSLKKYYQKVNNDSRINLLKEYGNAWNDYLNIAEQFMLTQKNETDAAFLGKAKSNPFAVLMRKNPGILFQKIPSQSIQKWSNLIVYTDHKTLKAYAYLLLNLNVRPEAYVSQVGPDKGSVIVEFYQKVMEKAADIYYKPLPTLPILNLNLFEMLGLDNTEARAIWHIIPPIISERYDAGILKKNMENNNKQFKLNTNNNKNINENTNKKKKKDNKNGKNHKQKSKRKNIQATDKDGNPLSFLLKKTEISSSKQKKDGKASTY